MPEIPNTPTRSRRDFFKTTALSGLGGLTLGSAALHANPGEQVEQLTRNVRRLSHPSDLKITDLRVAWTTKAPIVKIDTNQGIYGLGEVRDQGDPRSALMLKSRLLGKNPCNVESLFRLVKQFGGHGRKGGGVSGVEMALWDLAGKAYAVPVYQLLGGKYRDRIRLYADTPASNDPEVYARRMKSRLEKGYTFLKMDFGIHMVKDVPGALVGADVWDVGRQWDEDPSTYGGTMHPFTGVQITDLGIRRLLEFVAQVRAIVGDEIPMSADHFGHFDVNAAIRLGEALEPYRLAWLEDMIPWQFHRQWKQITEAVNTPTLTGEDIYLVDGFRKLVETDAIDMVHPDLASAGGILETKKIGDFSMEHGKAMALHFAGTPISFLANVHCAAATQNFIALEHHDVDTEWWESMVATNQPLVVGGYAPVPETPGLGVELNENVIRERLRPGEDYFAPTPEWNEDDVWDREWS